jgi:radical SAM protein (TIGR01212 family)
MRTGSRRPAPGPFAADARYNSYGSFLKEKFGCRVGKIVVDAGFSCPNRDGTVGTGGCTYCSNDAFRPATANRPDPIPVQIERAAAYLDQRYRARKFIVYFQPYSNTYAPLPHLIPLYEEALACKNIVGIAVGTRPDCVDEAKIAWFAGLARKVFVTLEYGLESTADATLVRINRGHDYACWLRAVAATRARGIHISAHLILGFPWEGRQEMLGMAGAVSGVGLDFLKLHHLHVVKNTELARQYQRAPFPLLAYEDYLDLVVEFLELLNPEIRLERLFGQAPEEQLLGPFWGKTKAEIQRDVASALELRDTWQGRLYHAAARPSPNGM